MGSLFNMTFYCQAHLHLDLESSSMTRTYPKCDLFCCILSQDLPLLWRASNIIPKFVCLCGSKCNWVAQWLTHILPHDFHGQTAHIESSMTRTSPPWNLVWCILSQSLQSFCQESRSSMARTSSQPPTMGFGLLYSYSYPMSTSILEGIKHHS